MSKTKLLLNVVEDAKTIGDAFHSLAEDLQILVDVMMQDEPQGVTETYPTEEAPEPQEPTVTLEQVRGVLAKLAQAGRQEEIKALITKYGATRLSDVDSANFQALLKEAEGM